MKRSSEKGSSSRHDNRKTRKSKSNLDKSVSKKRSLSKRSYKAKGKKRSSVFPAKVMGVGTRNTTKTRSKKESLRIRAFKKSSSLKPKGSSRPLKRSFRNQTSKSGTKKKVIRVLGQGQFSVDSGTLRRLNAIDNSIVRRFEKDNLTSEEFRMKIEQLGEIVTKEGKRLDPKKIISSDIILPSSDLTIEEASKIFHGEGIIPGLE
jgi:PspA-Associated protein